MNPATIARFASLGRTDGAALAHAEARALTEGVKYEWVKDGALWSCLMYDNEGTFVDGAFDIGLGSVAQAWDAPMARVHAAELAFDL